MSRGARRWGRGSDATGRVGAGGHGRRGVPSLPIWRRHRTLCTAVTLRPTTAVGWRRAAASLLVGTWRWRWRWRLGGLELREEVVRRKLRRTLRQRTLRRRHVLHRSRLPLRGFAENKQKIQPPPHDIAAPSPFDLHFLTRLRPRWKPKSGGVRGSTRRTRW